MWETVFLLTFAAFVLLAAYFVNQLEDKDDANDYNNEMGTEEDKR